MRQPLLSLIFILAPAPLLAGSFDLSLDEKNGERVMAVARSGGGAYAVAAGAEDLTVLTGEAADKALASLAKVDAGDDETEPADGKQKKAKKIVIHKMSIEDDGDGSARDEGKREVRVVRKTDSDRREERLLLEDGDHLIAGDGDRAAERRIIRMKGVDETQAIKFIDDAKGLDEGEKAQMKTAAGL